MGSAIGLGRICGIPVRIHLSWFAIFFVFIFIFEGYFGQRYQSWNPGQRWLASVLTTLLLFGSVLAHELSHSLVAIRSGIPVKGITLFIFGGVSHIAREAQRPSTEFIIAVVGPVSSLLIALLFLAVAVGTQGLSEHISAIAFIVAWVNITLAVFNMLPGFPLDGGRVLRAAAWRITKSYRRATKIATLGGQLIGIAMITIGVLLVVFDLDEIAQGLWLVVMGVFLYSVAKASQKGFSLQEGMKGYTARDVLSPTYAAAPENISLRELVNDTFPANATDLVVLTGEAKAVGVLIRGLIEKVPRSKWAETEARSVMLPVSEISVPPGATASEAVEFMEDKGYKSALVVDGGSVLGIIDLDRLRNFARSRLESAS